MSRYTIIRGLLTSVTLMLFTFSITPRHWLHDLFANHTDTVAAVAHDGNDHLHVQGFNCDCYSVVTHSPFTCDHHTCRLSLPVAYSGSITCNLLSPNYLQAFLQQELRGPPAV